MNRIILLLLFATTSSVFAEDSTWFNNLDKALHVSQNLNRPTLLVFSGSDWCKPCIVLKETVFDSDRFKAFAKDSLVLLNIDFPRARAKGESKEAVKAREAVAEKYNQEGSFPKVLLLNSDGSVLSIIKGVFSPEEYVVKIKQQVAGQGFYHRSLHKFKTKGLYMGSEFQFTALHDSEAIAEQAVRDAQEEVERIESLISSWDTDSQTSKVNKNAGIQPVKVDMELFQLIRRALKVSEISQGAFDITFAAMADIWQFDKEEKELPDSSKVLMTVDLVDYRNVVLDERDTTVFLKEKGMKIGFGAMGKGYAANRAKHVMLQYGIHDGLVNAGGDLIAWGRDEDQKLWKVGLVDPTKKQKYISMLDVEDMSVVTSGDYERYFTSNGIRYAHIIDPRTGYPSSGLVSVTIICPDAEIGDALATTLFVLGKEKGLALINAMDQVECVLVDDEQHMYTSNNLNLNYQ